MSNACTLPQNPHSQCLPMAYGSPIRGPGDILRYMKWLVCPGRDDFFAITMDADRRIIQPHMVSFEDISRTMQCVHKVFRAALDDAAMWIAVVHILPQDEDGYTLPEADEELCRQLCDTGMVLEIPLLDYITMAGTKHFSCSDEGMM